MAENNKQLAVTSSSITNDVAVRIGKMEKAGFECPKGFNITNALASVKLEIEEKNLVATCTQESLVKCLLKMATLGEDSIKGHFHLIPRGNECTYNEDYKGKMMRTYRDTDVVRINAQVVYDGDKFVYAVNKSGALELVEHTPNLKNFNKDKIIAAYAILVHKDGSTSMEIMTMDQIRQAWAQGATKGNSPAHKNFPDQMAKKTVIGRACKLALAQATGNDEELFDEIDNSVVARNNVNAVQKQVVDIEAEEVVDTNTGEIASAPVDEEACPV